MRPVVRIALELRADEIVRADQLDARTVNKLVIIYRLIGDSRTTEQRNPSHPGSAFERGLHSLRGAGHLDRRVDTLTAGQFLNLFDKTIIARIEYVVRAEFKRLFSALLIEVNRDKRVSARKRQRLDREHSEQSESDDHR